ncbi:MAG: anaerobic sulfatase-maturation protein [Bacteroidales bacterium]|nr:anaerobic sulfatase-maturation protein [Bacteroidales bacterium]HCI55419.1 anaerobic sulfatase maturase [Bacteroidales bacterium]
MPSQKYKSSLLFTDALKLKRPTAFNVMVKPAGSVCNLNCTYCYYLEKKKLYPGHSDFKMSERLLEEFTRQYIEANDVPVVNFTWQGGEPTLMGLDFFRKALELQKKYAGGKRIENAFQTNGTRLNDDWCKFFKDNNILVGISIDGEEHNHDHYRKTISGGPTFKQVMKGIELLEKHRVEFNTLSVVNDYNVHFALETYRFLKKIGSVFMQFLPVVERIGINISDDRLKLVSNEYGEKAQVAKWSVNGRDYGRFLITIFDEWVRNDVAKYYVQIFDSTLANWVGEMPGVCIFAETCGDALIMEHNGDVFSCDHYVYPENYLGNILEKPLIEMVKSQQQFDFGIRKRNSLPRQCLRCEVLFACTGECPKNRISVTDDGESGLNYLCEGYKMFYSHVKPYMEFMANELKNKRAPANVMQWIRNRENQVIRVDLPGRNDPCPCGSGKKYKNCCGRSGLLNA